MEIPYHQEKFVSSLMIILLMTQDSKLFINVTVLVSVAFSLTTYFLSLKNSC